MTVMASRSELQNRAPRIPVVLDRESPVPLYHQLYEQLAAAIQDGTLMAGDPFEQEVSIAQRLGLSRLTVRRTMSELVNHGLLVRGRGLGTVVAHRSAPDPGGLTSCYEDLLAAGRTPTTRVLTITYPRIEPRVARLLGMGAKTPLVYVERVRSSDGEPLAVLRNWLPPAASSIRFADLEYQGLYTTLRQIGLDPCVANQTIGARRAASGERDLLNIGRMDPVLTVDRLSHDAVGHPVEYGEHTYRGDRHEVRLTVRSVSASETPTLR